MRQTNGRNMSPHRAPRGLRRLNSYHRRMDAKTRTAHGFIERWQGVTASELATAQTFVMDLCELMGVRTAIHGPGDISPIGQAAALAVDASSRAFGIQESTKYSDAVLEVFPGAPTVERGTYAILARHERPRLRGKRVDGLSGRLVALAVTNLF